jgi:hypothetical protein
MKSHARELGSWTSTEIETTPHHSAAVDYHPEMQGVLLREANDAGVEVQRGVAVTRATGGTVPSVTASIDGVEQCFPGVRDRIVLLMKTLEFGFWGVR